MWKFYIVTGRLSRKHAFVTFVRRWSHAWTGPRPAAAGIRGMPAGRVPRALPIHFASETVRAVRGPRGRAARADRVRVAAEAAYSISSSYV